MSSVDNRVVSIKFDNAGFQEKIADTMKALDIFKSKLDFAGATKGLSDLSSAGSRFNMGNMSATIEGISGKFLAMSTIAITAISNITSRAISAGAQMASAFTIDPIKSGLTEYETNLDSIQTILSNTKAKGSSLADVNDALQKLNTYSDQTIYNFSQMAENIGTFTAAGVGLDTSVSSIKGIANLAAISGSSAEQAATAMYQLSQAIASGSVHLMDWNSVVNAGMGGEVFQKALFESGKAMHTLVNVPVDQTFEEWTKSGHSFRESLQKGWLTSEVLTNTLKGFTGDLTKAQIMSLGYTKEQAAQMIELGKTGKAAATQIKTLSQLMGTIKESIGSGWTQTWQLLLGNFDESKKLFTDVNNYIGNVVSNSAKARNDLLMGWRFLGGREVLIQGLKDSFKGLLTILKPIKDAFRDVFPKQTALDLAKITQSFGEFAKRIAISGETASKIKSIFEGFFSVFKIGFEVIKGVFHVVSDVISSLSGVGSGAFDFAANTGDAITNLRKSLVEGGGIANFFDNLSSKIKTAIGFVLDFTSKVKHIFDKIVGSDEVTTTFDKLGKRISPIAKIVNKVSDAFGWLHEKFNDIKGVISTVGNEFKNFFKSIAKNFENGFSKENFNTALDAFNVGFLGGIAYLLKKFLDNGLDLNIFNKDVVEKIADTFNQLTDTLKTMQLSIKANALLKIAEAVGVLTASVLVLSLINSAALTKALIAMSVGFGQLIGVMALLDKLNLTSSAIQLGGIATGMILLSVAAVILSGAVAILSKLSWSGLLKGLTGVTVLLLGMSATVKLMSGDSSGLIAAGIGMIGVASALVILSLAVKLFSGLTWTEIAKGLTGVAVGLGLLTLAMNFMPTGMLLTGIGLIGVATSLIILSKAVEMFSKLSWKDMARGLAGVGVALGIIAVAMNQMPLNAPLTAAGLIGVGIALNIIAKAVGTLGGMDLKELAKGIGAIAGIMLVLVVATNAMSGAIPGAIAMTIVSGALLILTQVLKALGELSIAQIVTGLVTIAASFLIIGGAAVLLSEAVPFIAAFGLALMLVGGGFALFGLGVAAVAKGFQILAETGKAGAKAAVETLKIMASALPELVGAIVKSIIDAANQFFDSTPELIGGVSKLIASLLDALIKNLPKLLKALDILLGGLIENISKHVPDFIDAGFKVLKAFLKGLNDNIEELTTAAIGIIVKFTTTLSDHAKEIVDAGVNMLTSFLGAISSRADDIVWSALFVLGAFVNALADNIHILVEAATNLINAFIRAIGDAATSITTTGVWVLITFLKGLTDNLIKVADAVANLITKFVTEVGKKANEVVDAGANVLTKFIEGLGRNLGRVADKGVDVVLKFLEGLGRNALRLANGAADVLVDFLNGLSKAIDSKSKDLREAGLRVAGAIINGMTAGLAEKAKDVVDAALDIVDKLPPAVRDLLGIHSPSKVFMLIGQQIAEGLAYGLRNDTIAETEAIKWVGRTVSAAANTAHMLANSSLSSLKFDEVAANLAHAFAIDRAVYESTLTVKDLANKIEGSLTYSSHRGSSATKKMAENVSTSLSYMGGKGTESVSRLAKNTVNAMVSMSDRGSRAVDMMVEHVSSALRYLGGKGQESINGLNKKLGDILADPVIHWGNKGTESVDGLNKEIISSVVSTAKKVIEVYADLGDFDPTIAPVFDLTKVVEGSKRLKGILGDIKSPTVSYNQASEIAHTNDLVAASDIATIYQMPATTRNYTQNIYAPKPLTAADIYRGTKSLIAMAKDDAEIA